MDKISLVIAVVFLATGVSKVCSAESAQYAQFAPVQAPMSSAQAPAAPSERPASPAHFVKVLFTTDSGGYTYIKYEEGGEEGWVAVMQMDVKVGDIIEFADSPPMVNFQSKSLGTKFDKLFFAPEIVILNKKLNNITTVEDEHVFLASKYHLANKYDFAIYEISKAIELSPNNAKLFFMRSSIYRSQYRYYNKYTSNLSQIMTDNKKYCEYRLYDLDKAISLDNKSEKYYMQRAEIYNDSYFCNFKDYEKAINDYDRAIQLNPSNAEYYISKGWIYNEMKNNAKVLECAKKVIALDPKNASGYYLYGTYYGEVKNYNKALEYLKKGLSLEGEFTIGSYYVDVLMEKTQKYKDAIELYTELIRKKPNNGTLYFCRAEYFNKMKNYNKALADYTAAIRFYPDSAYYYASRANSNNDAGNKVDALYDYKQACKMEHFDSCDRIPIVEGDIRRGDNWRYYAQTNVTSHYYDKSNISINNNGVISAWLRDEVNDKEEYIKELELNSYDKIKFKNVSHIMEKYDINCLSKEIKLISSYTYSDSGNVIRSYEGEKRKYASVIPGTIGSAMVEEICREYKPKKKNNK